MKPSAPHTPLFMTAVRRTLENEGGSKLTITPKDRGGMTRWGISQRAHPKVDIRTLTREQAVDIYWNKYWKPLYEKICSTAIAMKVFDLAVVMGHRHAHRCLQHAMRGCGVFVLADGFLGPKTIKGIKQACKQPLSAKLYIGNSQQLMGALKSEAAGRFRLIVAANPPQRKFLRGWEKRAYM